MAIARSVRLLLGSPAVMIQLVAVPLVLLVLHTVAVVGTAAVRDSLEGVGRTLVPEGVAAMKE